MCVSKNKTKQRQLPQFFLTFKLPTIIVLFCLFVSTHNRFTLGQLWLSRWWQSGQIDETPKRSARTTNSTYLTELVLSGYDWDWVWVRRCVLDVRASELRNFRKLVINLSLSVWLNFCGNLISFRQSECLNVNIK